MPALLLSVLLPIFSCITIGYLWRSFQQPYDSVLISKLITHIGAPALMLATMATIDLPLQQLAYFAFWVLLAITVCGLLALVVCRLAGWSIQSHWPALVFPNTGNIGLPLCWFTFGDSGLQYAMLTFVLITLVHFSIGIKVQSGQAIQHLLLRSPILQAAIAALLLLVSGWQLPTAIIDTLQLVGDITIPLMLITLGVTLAELQGSKHHQALAVAAGRLLCGAGAATLIVIISPLPQEAEAVIWLQLSMPMAVFSYLLAERYQQQPQLMAAAVWWSTVIMLLLSPLLVYIARHWSAIAL